MSIANTKNCSRSIIIPSNVSNLLSSVMQRLVNHSITAIAASCSSTKGDSSIMKIVPSKPKIRSEDCNIPPIALPKAISTSSLAAETNEFHALATLPQLLKLNLKILVSILYFEHY